MLDINESLGSKISQGLNNQGYEVIFKKLNLCETDVLEKNFNEFMDNIPNLDVFVNFSYPRSLKKEPQSFDEMNYNHFILQGK